MQERHTFISLLVFCIIYLVNICMFISIFNILFVIWRYRIKSNQIKFAMEFLWIPEKVRNFIMQYYSDFHMRFTTNQFTTSWQSLDVGIPMGRAISPIFFALAMEIIIRAAEKLDQVYR